MESAPLLNSLQRINFEEILACPECKENIDVLQGKIACKACGQEYKIGPDGVPLMMVGESQEDSSLYILHQRSEMDGMQRRVEKFFIPLLKDMTAKTGGSAGNIRLLDNGCGAGGIVHFLSAEGYDCWGIDPGARHTLWTELNGNGNFLVADGSRLPFKDSIFDLVTSFGVIEHVGISGDQARSRVPAFDCHEKRKAFIAESVRVLKPGGTFILAHPNGAFPIDFWHGGRKGIRIHIPYEGFLPSRLLTTAS